VKAKGSYLPDHDHVMRFVPWTKLRRDENDNVIGFLPQAFELRPDEDSLSVNWLEYFGGNRDENVRASITLFRDTRNVGKKSAFGVGQVGKIKQVCNANGAAVRISYDPESDNLSHSVIRRLPRDDQGLLDALASEAFSELIGNGSVEQATDL